MDSKQKYKFAFFLSLVLGAMFLITSLSHGAGVLDPKGPIARQERDLIILTVALMAVVVVPVFAFLFIFAWKYRASNTKAKYSPDLHHKKITVFIWWTVPIVIIATLSIVNWRSTHELDPYRPIISGAKPLTIQVVALDWKWLFIYPEQNIATVNFIQFPEDTSISFELTADAPMNSFWIPQLGGQMYAMAGMSTQLHLMANDIGEFRGSGAEINGAGFSGMHFIAKATSHADFDAWVVSVKQSGMSLDLNAYNELAKPSENNPVVFYASTSEDLYNSVVMKFIAPAKGLEQVISATPGMER